MMVMQRLLFVLLLGLVGVVQADDADIRASLEKVMPGITIDSVGVLDGTDLFEAVINGEIVYFNNDLR